MMLRYLNYLKALYQLTNELYSYRKISIHTLNEFQNNLSYETWENVFSNNVRDTNTTFNNFLNTFLRTFNASFPKQRTKL